MNEQERIKELEAQVRRLTDLFEQNTKPEKYTWAKEQELSKKPNQLLNNNTYNPVLLTNINKTQQQTDIDYDALLKRMIRKEEQELNNKIKDSDCEKLFNGDKLLRQDYELVQKLPIKYSPSRLSGNTYTIKYRRVTELNILGQELEKIPEQIYKLDKLQTLMLPCNEIREITDHIESLTELQKLYLSNNKIKYISPFIGNLTELQELHLERNQLTYLPDQLEDLTKLDYLNITHNEITERTSIDMLKRMHKGRTTIFYSNPLNLT